MAPLLSSSSCSRRWCCFRSYLHFCLCLVLLALHLGLGLAWLVGVAIVATIVTCSFCCGVGTMTLQSHTNRYHYYLDFWRESTCVVAAAAVCDDDLE